MRASSGLFVAALAVTPGLLGACGAGEKEPAPRVLKGEAVQFGSGVAHAWVALDAEDRPAELGVTLNVGTLDRAAGIPAGAQRLSLPRVPGLGFDHAEVEWHPVGHMPDGVFDQPHLDVRFFLIEERAREDLVDTLEAGRVPPLESLPPPYVPLPEFRPGSGTYWIDPTAAAFHGEPLGSSVAFGFYAGHMVFVEIKLGRSCLEAGPVRSEVLPLPERLPAAGGFPTRWAVGRQRSEWSVTLHALRWSR
jgi:hypothetical protein